MVQEMKLSKCQKDFLKKMKLAKKETIVMKARSMGFFNMGRAFHEYHQQLLEMEKHEND